jgi:hypothetical protein
MTTKNILFVCTFLLFLAACQSNKADKNATNVAAAAPQTPQTDPYLVASGQMGNAKIGMTKADLLKFYPKMKADTLQLEGELPCWRIEDTNGDTLFMAAHEEGKDSITFLFSMSPKMHTAQGVKIGDNYERLKAIYRDLTVGLAEGLMASSESARIAFHLLGEADYEDKENGEIIIKKVKSATIQTFEVW